MYYACTSVAIMVWKVAWLCSGFPAIKDSDVFVILLIGCRDRCDDALM